MKRPSDGDTSGDPREIAIMRAMAGFFDAAWYQVRYPDIAASGIDPLQHFIRHGAAERRDPNGFFDNAWYAARYPDIAASGLNPLLHYLRAGAAELRNPHPRFDAVYYIEQHPEAAANPLLYHLHVGRARGYQTEKPIDIRDYLPSERPALALPRKLVVDVVIPVYRGLAETQACLGSVLAAADGSPLGRIIVVEDRCPEPALVAWLRELAAAGRIALLRNPRNLGFVASVNRGMDAAGAHDVVLLNSDTEVAAGWLRRLAAQAYAQPRIASVSPFSNNAMICGYPDNAGGPLVFGHSVAHLDALCRTVNAGRSVALPTTVGFCMYLRRAALREVGPFDAERFAQGYGEENDFCLRASARGWQHRLACDTFVYHKGSVSFGGRTAKLSARAMRLILERYPDYAGRVGQHVSLDAVAPFRFAVTAGLFRQCGLPVILMISHNLGGGIRRHIEELMQRHRDTARVLLLEGTDRGVALSVPSLPGHPLLTLPAARLDDLVRVLRSMAVSRVHIHHLVRIDMDIRTLIHRLGVPFDVTVHDYYAICPQINLLPWPESLYCGEPAPAGCNACIAHNNTAHGAREILSWRRQRAWQFSEAERVICPSADVKARLQRHGMGDRAIVVPHEPSTATDWPLAFPEPPGSVLRIALLGVLANHKGARAVAALAEAAAPGTIELHLIGHLEDSFPKPAVKLIKATGPYRDTDVFDLLRQARPHVIWLPSSAPETYSYTLSTAIATGLPIVATDLGSFPERLAGRPYSWLVDHRASTQDWMAVFDDVRSSLRQPRQVLHSPPRPLIADFYADQYLVTNAKNSSMAPRRGGKPVIAVLPERLDVGLLSPCAYIRLLQPLDHPAIGGGFSLVITDAETVLHCKADIIVTQRYALPSVAAADALAAHARRTDASLVYDLDDDLLNLPRGHPDAAELQPRGRVVRRMLDHADVVWVSTPSLAARLASTRPDAVVIENRLDERIWTHAPTATPFQDDPVRILCMGTATHERDFAMLQPALVRLKDEYGDRLVIDVLGMTSRNDLPAGLNRIGPPPHAGQSYPGFVNWLTSVQPAWHIGLAPLIDSPFSRCKSPIKAMDYAAMGLFVLASDTPVYQGSIADGPAGQLIPNDPRAWYMALEWLLRDQDKRRSVAAQARALILAQGCLASQAAVRQSAWMQLLRTRRTETAA